MVLASIRRSTIILWAFAVAAGLLLASGCDEDEEQRKQDYRDRYGEWPPHPRFGVEV